MLGLELVPTTKNKQRAEVLSTHYGIQNIVNLASQVMVVKKVTAGKTFAEKFTIYKYTLLNTPSQLENCDMKIEKV